MHRGLTYRTTPGRTLSDGGIEAIVEAVEQVSYDANEL
jgi:hypothetical protein